MIECFDTSVVVAAIVVSHPFHAAALGAVRDVAARDGKAVICSHALAETFATLTRLPLRPAISASAAELIVTQELVRRYSVEAIEVGDQLEAIRLVVASGRSGSSVHDGLHVAVARRIGAARLWTFNAKHFEPLWDRDHVRVPGGIRNDPQ